MAIKRFINRPNTNIGWFFCSLTLHRSTYTPDNLIVSTWHSKRWAFWSDQCQHTLGDETRRHASMLFWCCLPSTVHGDFMTLYSVEGDSDIGPDRMDIFSLTKSTSIVCDILSTVIWFVRCSADGWWVKKQWIYRQTIFDSWPGLSFYLKWTPHWGLISIMMVLVRRQWPFPNGASTDGLVAFYLVTISYLQGTNSKYILVLNIDKQPQTCDYYMAPFGTIINVYLYNCSCIDYEAFNWPSICCYNKSTCSHNKSTYWYNKSKHKSFLRQLDCKTTFIHSSSLIIKTSRHVVTTGRHVIATSRLIATTSRHVVAKTRPIVTTSWHVVDTNGLITKRK